MIQLTCQYQMRREPTNLKKEQNKQAIKLQYCFGSLQVVWLFDLSGKLQLYSWTAVQLLQLIRPRMRQ